MSDTESEKTFNTESEIDSETEQTIDDFQEESDFSDDDDETIDEDGEITFKPKIKIGATIEPGDIGLLNDNSDDISISDDDEAEQDDDSDKTDDTDSQDNAIQDEKDVLPDSDDDDSEYDSEDDLEKFDREEIDNYVEDMHPEAKIHNYDEVRALSVVVRNDQGVIVDDLHKTIPLLTKYELSRVLGMRAKQINRGATPFVKVPSIIVDGYTIASMELKQKKIPFIIRRPLPNGGCEYWKVSDLELP